VIDGVLLGPLASDKKRASNTYGIISIADNWTGACEFPARADIDPGLVFLAGKPGTPSSGHPRHGLFRPAGEKFH